MLRLTLAVIAFAAGFAYRSHTSQDANDLLQAGFTIVDPQGFDVAKFD